MSLTVTTIRGRIGGTVCAVGGGRGAQGAADAQPGGGEGREVVHQLVKEPRARVDLSDSFQSQALRGSGRADSSLSVRSMESFPVGLPVSGLADPRTRLGALLFQAKLNFWKVCASLLMHVKCTRALTSENICGALSLYSFQRP